MTSLLRVLIADDERAARAKLRRLLDAHADLVIVAEASDGREAVAAIRAAAPDLVFLDIRMPELDGFEVLSALEMTGAVSPRVIFVTAYDEYAVHAFEVRAFDYLLKPYDGARLGEAIERVRAQVGLELRPTPEAVRALLESRAETTHEATLDDAPARYLERVLVRSGGSIRVVRVSELDWIEAYGNYVRLHAGGQRILARETLKRLVDSLDPAHFCRVHRSAIANLDRIREMKPAVSGDSIIRLESGIRLRLSRSFRPEVERRLREL